MLYFDRAGARLLHAGSVFDLQTRCWVKTVERAGEQVELSDAVRWLQRESGSPCRVPIAVIGPRDANEAQRDTAFAIGAGLAGLGLTMLCGGKGGVMEAACAGVASAGGLSIGLLPDDDWQAANPFVGVPIATGIGVARNAIVARAALALIAVGGGYGTLSEIAFGLQFGRPVLTLGNTPAASGSRPFDSPDAALTAICRIVIALPV